MPSLVASDGPAGAWLRERWKGSALGRRVATPRSAAASGFWLEWSREMRRQASDDRLPLDLRAHLRERARRAMTKAAVPPPASGRFPRRALRERVPASLPVELERQAMEQSRAAGIDLARPIVAIDVQRRPDTCEDASAWLIGQGWTVVQMRRGLDPLRAAGVVNLSGAQFDTSLLELFVLLRAAFLICDSNEMQHVGYVTNTPTLLLNARDPFSAYPVRDDGLFTLSTAIDLDTGRTLPTGELLREDYFRPGRHFAFRDATPAGVLAAVHEMHEGVTSGWHEQASQARFREDVIRAGHAMANRVPAAVEWGPDGDFIGDGRLAAWQADTIENGRGL